MLHNAIAEAIAQKAQMENVDIACVRRHIELYQNSRDTSSIVTKQERLKAIQERIEQLTCVDNEAAQNGDFDEQFEILYAEMYAIKDELAEVNKARVDMGNVDSLAEITTIVNGLKNHPVEYNDMIVRQLIECIKVMSANLLYIYFKDGIKIEANI